MIFVNVELESPKVRLIFFPDFACLRFFTSVLLIVPDCFISFFFYLIFTADRWRDMT